MKRSAEKKPVSSGFGFQHHVIIMISENIRYRYLYLRDRGFKGRVGLKKVLG